MATESWRDECEVVLSEHERLITVTWGPRLDCETAYGFILSYSLHKLYPHFSMLVDFRQVGDMGLLINDVMRLADAATRVFDVDGAHRRTAFLIRDEEQESRALQYFQLRQMLSNLELRFGCFFNDDEARRWLGVAK